MIRGPGPRSAAGFTLIEIVVAFAVLSVVLTALLQVFQQGLGSLDSAQRHSEAVLLAQSKLDEFSTVETLEPGRFEGSVDGDDAMQWTVNISEYEGDSLGPVDDGPLAAYHVGVEMRWDDGAVQLESIRLAARE